MTNREAAEVGLFAALWGILIAVLAAFICLCVGVYVQPWTLWQQGLAWSGLTGALAIVGLFLMAAFHA